MLIILFKLFKIPQYKYQLGSPAHQKSNVSSRDHLVKHGFVKRSIIMSVKSRSKKVIGNNDCSVQATQVVHSSAVLIVLPQCIMPVSPTLNRNRILESEMIEYD